MSSEINQIEQNPFLFDYEQLQAIAPERVIRQGLAWFKENRVTDLSCDGKELCGSVEDPESEEIFFTSVSYDSDGNHLTSCECDAVDQAVCGHLVALFYAYADQEGVTDELLGAADDAIKERIKSGRSEVRVKHLGGDPWFGAWRASSITTASHFPREYRVNIRSLQRQGNFCSCPDFANNQLGTCKHIEAVLHTISKRRDYNKIKHQTAPRPYVYLSWEVESPPQIVVHRTTPLPKGLKPVLNDYFDAAGLFKGSLPDDFFHLTERVHDRTDIDLGDDAVAHASHLAANLAHQVRAKEIRQRIESSGGHLPGIRARLYPYQVEGAAFLVANGRALLADDMGLGKTLQAITAAIWLQEHAEAKRLLIICPASLKHQWAREIARFSGQQAQVVYGPPPTRGAQYRRSCSFFIINYELVLRDLSVINETLQPDLLILDEAQRIKNWRTKIASAVKLIPTRYAFVLTGTPLENRLEDLYSLMQVVDGRILGPLWRYRVDFHVTNERGKVLGYRNLSELRRRLTPAMLRRDRTLVRDQLPDRIEQRLDIALTSEQQELHDDAMKRAGILAQRAKQRPLTPVEQNRLMAALQQARMACNAAGLVDKETQGSPKLDELVTILDELCLQSGLKAVIFSQWELMTRMVEERVKQMGLGYVRLHGGVPSNKRGELMDRFREDDSVQVFISTDAGGTGLNLQSASVVINLDIPWNPAILDQRIARVHRLGQKSVVQVILMVAFEAYEGRVMGLVMGKRDLFDNVVDPQATEDVVGVSKKLLETLVEDLAEPKDKGSVAEDAEEIEMEPEAGAAELNKSQAISTTDEQLRHCIEMLQGHFGSRIERVLGTGGGLVVVMDQVDEEADRFAQELSAEVPVALIDPRTLYGLQRLRGASPLADGEIVYQAAGAAGVGDSRLSALAKENLKAAQLLIEQQCQRSAVELLVSAMLAAAGSKAKADQPPTMQEAGVWLFAQALPKGWLNQEQAALIMRAISLSQAAELPEMLLRELIEDTSAFVLSL